MVLLCSLPTTNSEEPLSLSEIKHYINLALRGDETIDERLDIFLKQREQVKAQMAELQEALELVEFKCWYYETAKKEGTVSRLKNLSAEELPKEFKHVKEKIQNVPKTN